MPARNASTKRARSRERQLGDRTASSKSNSITSTNLTSNANSKSVPRSAARPGTVTRTSSAPLAPSAPSADREAKLLSFDSDFNVEPKRGSVASVSGDPFFRNYQSPNSVSLAKELRSATYSSHFRDEEDEEDMPDVPPRSPKRPTIDNSVNLPVCAPRLNT